MKRLDTPLEGVIVLEPQVFQDTRGFFYESYNEETFRSLGIHDKFVQDNHSGSRKGVLRGLHYQICHPQAKLVRVISGEIFDVAVDIRRSSPTFGKWFGIHLSAKNKKQLYISVGFAHGFLVLSEWAEVLYKTTDFYAPHCDRVIIWNDPTISIKWPLDDGMEPILSPKDAQGLRLEEADLF
ncbi:MAG: dTDP-4-dehydrorhamnose 3,5-epimerase [Syntrophobacterales bacterium]|nr:dTDP-4-dehydrorhamnose 3,5-epimerase [Syntrophobacterales bacterium]